MDLNWAVDWLITSFPTFTGRFEQVKVSLKIQNVLSPQFDHLSISFHKYHLAVDNAAPPTEIKVSSLNAPPYTTRPLYPPHFHLINDTQSPSLPVPSLIAQSSNLPFCLDKHSCNKILCLCTFKVSPNKNVGATIKEALACQHLVCRHSTPHI